MIFKKFQKQSAQVQTQAMSIVLEYDVANEAAVKAFLENLKSLCVNKENTMTPRKEMGLSQKSLILFALTPLGIPLCVR